MKYKIVHRQDSVLAFDDEDPTNYVASVQVFKYGDKGIMYNLNGVRFYELLAEHGPAILKQLNVDTMEGYVTPSHARLIRAALRTMATVGLVHRGTMEGNEMVWISIRKKVPPKGSIEDIDPNVTLDIRLDR